MLENGLLEEVKKVINYKKKNALRTVGYSEIFDFLDDKISLEEATEKIKVNTRRYAKRQLGWFNKSGDYKWFHPNEIDSIKKFISSSSF